MPDTPCVIGEGIQIRGKLSGSGNLVVRGRVDGSVTLEDDLQVDETGVVVASLASRTVTVHGRLTGDINASDAVSIRRNAVVIGDIIAPEIEIADGAQFSGRLDMDLQLPDDI